MHQGPRGRGLGKGHSARAGRWAKGHCLPGSAHLAPKEKPTDSTRWGHSPRGIRLLPGFPRSRAARGQLTTDTAPATCLADLRLKCERTADSQLFWRKPQPGLLRDRAPERNQRETGVESRYNAQGRKPKR